MHDRRILSPLRVEGKRWGSDSYTTPPFRVGHGRRSRSPCLTVLDELAPQEERGQRPAPARHRRRAPVRRTPCEAALSQRPSSGSAREGGALSEGRAGRGGGEEP